MKGNSKQLETLTKELIAQKNLSLSDREEMYQLFEQYYINIDKPSFLKDLSEKDHVFRFLRKDGSKKSLVGFSTIMAREIKTEQGRPVLVLFSGDTVIAKEYWGNKMLQSVFFKYIVRSKFRHPFRPVCWMLISKGFKTYLMMRRNFSSSYPSAQEATPSLVQNVMDIFYGQKFGSAYSPATGLIRFQEISGATRPGMAEPKAADLENREIDFFLQKNPDYLKGVELACAAEIRMRDFPLHIIKYFFSPFIRRAGSQKAKTFSRLDEQLLKP